MMNNMSVSPSFGSKVYITNYASSDMEQREIMNSDSFLNGLKKLKNNGNKDTVVITPSSFSEDIYFSLSQRNPRSVKTVKTIILQDEDITDVYANLKKQLKRKDNIVISDPIIDYMI
mgnify:CR=1 FL=1